MLARILFYCDGGVVGGFIVNPSETLITKIGIDTVFQKGLYYANDSGGLTSKTITWQVQARLINDEGEAIGSWFTMGSETFTAATNTPQRLTKSYNVSSGRYEVRAIRTDVKDTSARSGHEIRWEALRGYMTNTASLGSLTLLAVKMRATDNLSQQSSRLVNVIATRKLKTWSPSSGWSALTPTRSIVWAITDILKANYGAKLSDDRLDLTGLYQLDILLNSRGDYFDGCLTARLRFGRLSERSLVAAERFHIAGWNGADNLMSKSPFRPRCSHLET
jgi:hypothetical protein